MVISFISGIYMTTFLASGFFFLKFHRSSGDRFFLGFALACWLLAIERIVLLFFPDPIAPITTTEMQMRSLVHLIRLVAFLIILFAVIDKNRKSTRK